MDEWRGRLADAATGGRRPSVLCNEWRPKVNSTTNQSSSSQRYSFGAYALTALDMPLSFRK